MFVQGPDGNTALTYDADGNLVSKVGPQGTASYSYDALNKLIGWSDGTNQVAYAHDGDGYRISRTANGQTTLYAQDQLAKYSRVLLETNSSYQVTRFYDYGLARTSQIDGTGTSYFLYDKPGRSVVTLERDGNVPVARYKFSAFGVEQKLGSAANSYGYTGEEYDSLSGLVFLRNRYYEPGLERFVSRDTFSGLMASPQTLNHYAYVMGNPLSLVDPLGLAGMVVYFNGYSVETGMGFSLPLGHAGVVAIDDQTGRGQYFDFGRYGGEYGNVRGPDGCQDRCRIS